MLLKLWNGAFRVNTRSVLIGSTCKEWSFRGKEQMSVAVPGVKVWIGKNEIKFATVNKVKSA